MSQRISTSVAVPRRAIVVAALVLGSVVTLAAATSVTSAEDEKIVADVDGEPITATEVEQRLKVAQWAGHTTPSRQAVIDDLRREKMDMRDARNFGIKVADAEVDAAYAAMATRRNLTAAELTEDLANADILAETLRQAIRVALTRHKLASRPRVPEGWRE
jgi:peptidyl-prolyl cis-trans isomerase SurA